VRRYAAWTDWVTLTGLQLAALAFAVRLVHVVSSAKLLVADDAVFFEQHAVAFVEAWRAIGTQEFGGLLRDALDHASLQGPLYPLFLSTIYSLSGGINHTAAALIQAVLSTFTVWLTFATTRRAFGGVAGVAAGGAAALYVPFVLSAGLLLAEAVLLFVQALAAYLLVRAFVAGAWRARLLAGLMIGLLMLRPAFQHAGLLSLVGLAAALAVGAVAGPSRRRTAALLTRAAPYACGLALVALPWIVLNGTVYGSYVWSRTGDAWQQVYWGIYPPNRGWWPPDSPVPPKYGVESLPGARAAGRVIEVRDLDYLEAAIAQVRATPLQALATEVNKVYQAYLHPFNTYAERVPLVGSLAVPLHRLVAWLGLAGAVLAWRRPAPALAQAGLAAGVALPFLASHVDVRYVMPIALAALPFAGLAVSELVGRLAWLRAEREAAVPAVSVALASIAWAAGVPVWLAFLPALEPLVAHRLHTALVCLAFVAASAWIGWWLGGKRERVFRWRVSGVTAGLVSAALFCVQAFYDGDWHEWSTVLRPGEAAAQRITLPPGWSAPPGARAEVRLYAQGSPAQTYVPRVLLNGREVARLGPAFIEGGPLRFEERLMVTARLQGKARADVPQWYGVPVEIGALAGGAVDVGVTLDGPGDAWIRVWGDYPPAPGRRVLEAPSIHSRIQGQDDSFHKLVSTGHPRLWRRFPLTSAATIARIETAAGARSDDLSPAPGRQTGELRLRLVIFGPAGDLLAVL
jgi:hypothetical protein